MLRPLRSFEAPCGYGCGRPYRPWHGSKLNGHALCAISDEAQDEILAVAERFPVGQQRMARDLGVSIGTLRAWLAAAMKRRAARRAV